MAIIGIQQSQTETGRIRLGVYIPPANGKKGRPVKLDRLRFTSPRRELIEKIADLYGGKVEPWQPPKGNQQWQVITDATEVPVMVPPQDPSQSQWFELWSAGGCQRRCDGQKETISKGACLCDPEPSKRDCSMHTRLRVMLEDVPGLGVWRVDTGSYYAAVELPGIAMVLSQAQGIIPGRLILDQRTVTRLVDGKPKTMNFAVPVLDIAEFTPGQLASGKVQELITARRAAAVEGQMRAEIEAAPLDYPSLIEAAKTVEALYELHRKAKDVLTPELTGAFERKAAAIRAAQPQPEVVDATVVSEPVEPEPAGDGLEELWHQILEASPWDDADELERNFCEIVGRSSDEAGADDMRKFLAAIEQAKAGETA
jgi:hypothetical protein